MESLGLTGPLEHRRPPPGPGDKLGKWCPRSTIWSSRKLLASSSSLLGLEFHHHDY